MGIPRRPIHVSFASARLLNANSAAASDTVSTRVAMPCSAEGGALISHADELEELPAAEQDRVDQVEVAGFPEPRDFALIELPEFLLIEAVEPGQRQRCSVIQANIEQDRREKLQRDQCGNELLGRCP